MKKWLGWTALIFVFQFIALQLVLIFYHDSIRKRIEKEIDKNVNAYVFFDDIQLSIWKHFPNVTLEFRNLLVTGKEEFEGDTLIQAPSLGLELDVINFFRDDLKLKSILLDGPEINILISENRLANYSIVNASPSQSGDLQSELRIDLEQVTVNEGNLIYDDRASKTLIRISDFQHKGTGDFIKEVFDYTTQTYFNELTIDYNGVRYLDKKRTNVELGMAIDTRIDKFTILHNSIAINHFNIGLEGSFAMLPNGYDIDLRFAAHETSLKNILSILPGFFLKDMEHIQTGGEAAFHGFINGKYLSNSDTLPAFRLDLEIKDGFFKIDTLAASLKNIQFDLSIDHTKGILDSIIFDLQTMHFEIGDQPVHGRFKLQGLDKFKIDADIIAGLNLHEIETIFPVKGLDLKGRADLEFKARGNFVRGIENGPDKRPAQIPPFHIDLKMKDGSFKYDTLPAGMTGVKFHLVAKNPTGKVEDTSIHFEDMSMKMDESNAFNGYVHVDGFNDFKIDTDIKANLDLADLERIFPMKGYDLKGNLNMDIKAKGDYDQEKRLFPLVDANFDLTNGYMKSDDYPEPIEEIHLVAEAINKTGTITSTQLAIKQFTYTLEGEPFTVTGTVNDFDKYEYDFKIKGDVDLEKITKIYPIPGMKLSGKIYSRMETKGKLADLEQGNYQLVSTTGGFRFKELRIEGDNIPLPIYISEAQFGFTPEKIVLKAMNLKVGKSNVKLKGDLFNYMYFLTKNSDLIKGDLVLECDTLFVNEWMNNMNKRRVGSVAADTLELKSRKLAVIEVPKNVEFVFDSDIKNLIYDDLKITSLDGEIKIKDGIMSLHETGFNSLNAQFNINGDYDTRDMAHPLFDFNIKIEELDIAKAYKEIKLMRDLAPATADCEGQFSIDYSLKGEIEKDMSPKMETIKGGGRLRIANAKIDGMKIFEELSKAAKRESMNNPHLKDFVMDTEIHDSRLYVKPFTIKVSGFNTEIEGVNELNGTIQYLIKVELLPIEKLRVPFHVTGTYNDPKVAIGKGHKLPE
jgi:AsmA protein